MDVINLQKDITYQEGSIVSKEISKSDSGSMTIFAFDKGQGLSEHKTPFDAYAAIIDGTAEITVGGKKHRLNKGEMLHMPPDVPHSVHAPGQFKMILVMVKK